MNFVLTRCSAGPGIPPRVLWLDVWCAAKLRNHWTAGDNKRSGAIGGAEQRVHFAATDQPAVRSHTGQLAQSIGVSGIADKTE